MVAARREPNVLASEDGGALRAPPDRRRLRVGHLIGPQRGAVGVASLRLSGGVQQRRPLWCHAVVVVTRLVVVLLLRPRIRRGLLLLLLVVVVVVVLLQLLR